MNLTIDNLSFSYGKHNVFSNYNLKLESGINVLLGANGSGKTTLFKILTTIFEPKKGMICLNGFQYNTKEYRKHISYIPQIFDIYPGLKVRDFLGHIAQLKYQYSKEKIEEEITRVSAAADITDFTNKKMKDCSEGMRKRVGIAQALLGDADFIVADEPTAGLDPEQRNKFNMVLKRIPADKIVLISTHIIEDIKDYYDNIIILSEGKITFQGNYEELMSSLDNRVAELTIGSEMLSEYESKYKIISKNFEDEKITIKFVVDEMTDGMNMVVPTITDIWTFYR